MKKILVFASLFVSVITSAQTFVSETIDYDTAVFNQIMKTNKPKGNKNWAAALADSVGVDDNGVIIFKHVIEYTDSLSVDLIIDKTIEWVHLNFSDTDVIKTVDRESEIKSITLEASLGKVAENMVNLIYYVKKIDIYADIYMTIKFKDNRLRIESYTKHYTYNSGDSLLSGKHFLIAPGDVYPFTEDSQTLGDKATCAVAYINTVDNLLRFHRIYKDYLNKEFEKVTIDSTDEDW